MNIEDDILIEHFLRNLLSDSENELVKERMKTDTAFKTKVDFERELLESLNEDDWHFIKDYNKKDMEAYSSILKSKEFKDLKEELKRVNEDYKTLNSEPKQLNWKRILVSSAAVFAIMLSIYMFTSDSSSKELYVEYLNTSELPSLVSRDDAHSDMVGAQYLFEDKKYKDALIIFNETLTKKDESALLLLYKGVSEMELNNFAAAELTFETLINSDLLDSEKGHWYKALLFLKQDDKESTKDILESIVSKSLYNSNKAKDLLKEIN